MDVATKRMIAGTWLFWNDHFNPIMDTKIPR
jgi:hypothetical protein